MIGDVGEGVRPDSRLAPQSILARVPRDFARRHLLLPQEGPDGPIILHGSGSDACAAHNLRRWLGVDWRMVAVEDGEALATAIDGAYEAAAAAVPVESTIHAELPASSEASLEDLLARAERDLLSTAGKAPLVRLVDALLFEALSKGASDLHIQPLPDRIIVRHRIDGVLDRGRVLGIALLKPVVSRIKVMAGMDVAEHLLPQDGRTSVRIGGRACDVRVSTLPTPHGERVVLRLLDASRQLQAFADLGMPAHVADAFLSAARRSSGMILVTGPTGSGKTTTLYATLRELESRERNIMTIEDPIEYELDSLGLPISQSQVNARKGITFANGLRHILRQDPDIILVGEIRDAETARVAIQSSLTGHLVFSTLHTNDACSAVTRLIDLGVEPYLVAASLSVVVAQRLVRTSCSACGGSGCPVCNGMGYKGRNGIFELLPIDETLRTMISGGASLQDLRRQALAAGMKPLVAAGEELVSAGRTTQAEVERVVRG